MKLKTFSILLFVAAFGSNVMAQNSAWYTSIGLSNYGETNAVLAPMKHADFYNSDMRIDMFASVGRLYRFGQNKDLEGQVGLGFYRRSASFNAEGVWAKASETYLAADLMFNVLLQNQQKPQLCGVVGFGLHVATNIRQIVSFADGRPTEKASSNQGIYSKFAPKVQAGLRYAISPNLSVFGMVNASIETKALSIAKPGQHNFFYFPVGVEFGTTFSLGRKNKTATE